MNTSLTTDPRTKLKEIEGELGAAREERAVLQRETEKAKAAFVKARDNSPKSAVFKRAQKSSEELADAVKRIDDLKEVQTATLKMFAQNGSIGRDQNGPRSGDGAAGDGYALAARELNLGAGNTRVEMAARDLLRSPMAAVTVSPSEGLTAPSVVGQFVQKPADKRFLYPLLAHQPVDPGVLALTEFTQTGSRTVTGEVERDPVATTTKADLALGVALATPSLKQFAVTISKVPSQLLESIDVFYSFLRSEMAYQLDLAVDAHVLAQIAAATPAKGKTGTTIVERTRNAVAAMRALGANPTILALSPTDAAALDVTKTELGYVFATRDSGSASPLWGLQIVENPRITVPVLLDPALLGVLYSELGTLLVDPFTSMEKNLIRLRAEFTGLFHVRSAEAAYLIE
jgi:hypothetical protein